MSKRLPSPEQLERDGLAQWLGTTHAEVRARINRNDDMLHEGLVQRYATRQLKLPRGRPVGSQRPNDKLAAAVAELGRRAAEARLTGRKYGNVQRLIIPSVAADFGLAESTLLYAWRRAKRSK